MVGRPLTGGAMTGYTGEQVWLQESEAPCLPLSPMTSCTPGVCHSAIAILLRVGGCQQQPRAQASTYAYGRDRTFLFLY